MSTTYTEYSDKCIKCGGDMIGNGHTSVTHCEYAKESSYDCVEPDGGPIYCDYEDSKVKTAPSDKAVTWANNLETWDVEHQVMPSTKRIMREIDPPFGHDSISAHIQHIKKIVNDKYFLNVTPNHLSVICPKYFYLAIEKLRAVGC